MSARISDLTELLARASAASRPGIAKASLTNRDRWKKRAIERFEEHVVLEHEGSGRKLGATLEANESALRRPEASLPMPWWLECLLEREPELLAGYLRSFLEDLERNKKTGT